MGDATWALPADETDTPRAGDAVVVVVTRESAPRSPADPIGNITVIATAVGTHQTVRGGGRARRWSAAAATKAVLPHATDRSVWLPLTGVRWRWGRRNDRR